MTGGFHHTREILKKLNKTIAKKHTIIRPWQTHLTDSRQTAVSIVYKNITATDNAGFYIVATSKLVILLLHNSHFPHTNVNTALSADLCYLCVFVQHTSSNSKCIVHRAAAAALIRTNPHGRFSPFDCASVLSHKFLKYPFPRVHLISSSVLRKLHLNQFLLPKPVVACREDFLMMRGFFNPRSTTDPVESNENLDCDP